jgi:uncharacterized protein (DUF2235 family)
MPEVSGSALKLPKKRLALFLDGTWNVVSTNTNVWRLKSLCSPTSVDGAQQVTYYDVGVNGFWGGAFGKGLSDNVIEAYEWLIDQYNAGDEVFLFGFSRGAYTARSLAGFIAKYGLLKPGSPLGVEQLYDRYRRADDSTIWKLLEARTAGSLGECSLEEQWMLKYSQAIQIKLVAVWDTVGSLGIPLFSIQGISSSTLSFLHTGLRLSIENGYHALAIDEHRRSFAPTLWTTRTPTATNAVVAAPRAAANVEQRWFVGTHGNVGGGYPSDLLAQIPLRWIMIKAAIHGLAFRTDVELDGDVLRAPIPDSHKEFMYSCYRVLSPRWYYRPIGKEPLKKDDGTHTNVNETIDVSVFDRWRAQPQYRPDNLAAWAKRHQVDIGSLDHSVMASEPRTLAPE